MRNRLVSTLLAFTAGLASNAFAQEDIQNNFWATLSCSDNSDMARYMDEYPNGLYANEASQCLNGHVAAGGGEMENWTIDYGTIKTQRYRILAIPATGGRTSYFIAPAELLGDWREHAAVALRIRSWGGDPYGPGRHAADGDVVITSGPLEARYDMNAAHSGEWEEHAIPLRDDAWQLSHDDITLEDILADVTGFRIRAEYGFGTDFSAVSGVRLLSNEYSSRPEAGQASGASSGVTQLSAASSL